MIFQGGDFSRNSGYTLIELIIVIALIGIMLFFSIPRFQEGIFTSNTKKVSRWIIVKVNALKHKAVSDRKTYTLHVSIDKSRIWVTHDAMSEDEIENAQQQGYVFPEDLKVLDVVFPGREKISQGVADICFYKEGYSDKALIHIENDDNRQISFVIEPFLPKVKFHDKYLSFDD